MKRTFLPPLHPWGENRSATLFQKYTLYSLFAVSIPVSPAMSPTLQHICDRRFQTLDLQGYFCWIFQANAS